MDVVTWLVKLAQEHPTTLGFAIMSALWWLERKDKLELQKVNFELQDKFATALSDAKSAISQGNVLLQMLINSGGR